ncbi:MAG: alpha/beta hydrolase [Cyclobacteriaceae bacterium]
MKLVSYALLAVLLFSCNQSRTTDDHITGYIDIKDGKLYYEESGIGEALVFIGGGGLMDSRQWQDQINFFRNKYRTISIDPRGIGNSEVPFTSFSNSDDLKMALDILKIDKAVIVGLSYAGGIALDFAVSNPDRISLLICSGPLISGWEFSESMVEKQRIFFEASTKGVEEFIKVAFDQDPYFIPSPKNPKARSFARSLIKETFEVEGFDQSLIAPLEPPTIQQVGEIKIPSLLIGGQLDHPDIHARIDFLDEQIDQSEKVIIQNAGHIVNMENPVELNIKLSDFLEKFLKK